MSDFERFQDMFERAESSSKREGKYLSMLDQSTQDLLAEFVVWLEGEGISEASRRSYKTYVAKAMALPESKLDSNQRSGVKKFREFLTQR